MLHDETLSQFDLPSTAIAVMFRSSTVIIWLRSVMESTKRQEKIMAATLPFIIKNSLFDPLRVFPDSRPKCLYAICASEDALILS